MTMTLRKDVEETRWEVVKALLDEFPSLRQKVRLYLKNEI
jgi:hypothetical protein